MRRLSDRWAVLLLLLLSLPSFAQAPSQSKTLFGAADRYLWRRQRRGALDTAYVAVPEQRWTLKLYTQTSAMQFFASDPGQTPSSAVFRSRLHNPIGISASYRGLTASFSRDFSRSPKDGLSASLNSYGNRFCMESNFTADKLYYKQAPASHLSLNLDLFYFGNGNRFSAPAVFNQSKLQRKSCGSWIAAISAKAHASEVEDSSEVEAVEASGFTVGIGGGYAYNWVLDGWLLHFSLIPTLVIYDNTHVKTDTWGGNIGRNYLNTIATGHFAALYNFGSCFTGITCSVNNCDIGPDNSLSLDFLRIRGSFVFGIRL